MSQTGGISPREALFCCYLLRLGNPAEAAIRAGYQPNRAQRTAMRLLRRQRIREELECYRQAETAADARTGLERASYGAVNDAVRLMLRGEELTDEELHRLDLFGVSEIKHHKGGGWEVKFFDRLRALQLLLQSGGGEAPGHSLYQALERSAAALAEEPGDRHDL